MANELEGYAELTKKLRELASPKENLAALKESVRKPMQGVMKQARANISAISPGEAETHKTYKGRIVSAGFASRSLRIDVRVSRDKTRVSAVLGVLREAFYAVQFFELGTSAIPKQPWLVPAFEASRSAALQAVGKTMRARIERIAKKRAAAAAAAPAGGGEA